MAIFTGFFALGTGVSNIGAFVEATTYTRPAVNFTGNALAGLSQAVGQITGPTGPVGGTLTKGAIFDAVTGGNLLAYWDWTTITAVPANFAAVTLNVAFNSYLSATLNMSQGGGAGTSGATIDQGAQIGTVNGQPMIAGTKLGIQAGTLVAQGGAVINTPTAYGSNVTLTGSALFYETFLSGIVAGTTRTAAGATALTRELNRIDTSTAPSAGTSLGDGVMLMAAGGGLDVTIINNSGNPIQVYGNGGDTIDGAAGNAGVTQMARSCVIYECSATGAWSTDGLSVGYSASGLQTVQPLDAVIALGTTQATATPLTGSLNTIGTTAPGTGVNLPSSVNSAGLSVVITNNGANQVQVYPAQGAADTINGVAASIGVAMHPGSVAAFNCTLPGSWTVSTVSPVGSIYNTNAATGATTLTAANITGAQQVVALNMTGALGAGANAQLPTVSATILAMHTPAIGSSFILRVINTSSGAFAWTVTTNAGWTLGGLMTVAQNTWRDFNIKLNTLTTATIQSIGSGTL